MRLAPPVMTVVVSLKKNEPEPGCAPFDSSRRGQGHLDGQAVQAVQGDGLVALGRRRKVEHRFGKIMDLAVMGHERLADVDQLAGAFAQPQS